MPEIIINRLNFSFVWIPLVVIIDYLENNSIIYGLGIALTSLCLLFSYRLKLLQFNNSIIIIYIINYIFIILLFLFINEPGNHKIILTINSLTGIVKYSGTFIIAVIIRA